VCLGLQCRDQALVGQQRRVDATGQITQIVERGAYAALHRGHELPDGRGVVGGFLQQTEVNRERDELLLRPVVQVPLNLPSLGVLRFHQAPAGGPQLIDRGLQLRGQRGVAQDQACLRR
jgi:hypothetical protein